MKRTKQLYTFGSETPHTQSLLSVLSVQISKAKPPGTAYTSHKPINKAHSPWLFAKRSAAPIEVQRASSSLTNKPENGAFGTARVTAIVAKQVTFLGFQNAVRSTCTETCDEA